MAGYLNANLENLAGGDALSQALDFVGWNQKRQYNQEALRQQQINRDMALEDLFQTRQINPLRLESERLSNEGTGLDNILKGFTNQTTERNLNVRKAIPIEDEITAAKTKLAKEITEDDLKATTAALEKALVNPSPSVRAQARMLRDHMTDIVKMREEFQSKESIEEIKAAAREAAAKEASARQLATIAARRRIALDAAKAKGPRGYEEAATRYRMLAEEADDPAVRQRYLAMANEFEQAKLEAAKAGKAGQIDAGAVAGLPTTEVAPKLGAGQAPKSGVPKAPAGRVIIYKDGKPVGSVPESQREDAVKQGYTLQ